MDTQTYISFKIVKTKFEHWIIYLANNSCFYFTSPSYQLTTDGLLNHLRLDCILLLLEQKLAGRSKEEKMQ